MKLTGADIWQAVKRHYAEWWLLFGLTWLPVFAWFTPTALPAMMFIWGVPFLVFLGRMRRFWPAAAVTFAMVALGFLRSEFVTYLFAGHSFGEAFATKYWFAPTFVWLVSWAIICGFDALPDDQAPRVAGWFGWLVVALAGVQLIECFNMPLRYALNNAFYGGARPEMLIVGMANCNTFLTMLFWPLAFNFVDRRQYAPVGILAAIIAIGAVRSDTNAHLLAMVASTAVFFAVRHWPARLNGLAPWKVMAGLTAASILIFPVLIYGLVRSGLGEHLRQEVLPSWGERIRIWTFTLERALEKPWFGWGYEASRMFEATNPAHPPIPNHPHNMSLQAWMELGVPGLLVLAGLWLAVFWLIGPREGYAVAARTDSLQELGAPVEDRPMTALQRAVPYMLAAGTAYFVVNTISYGLWRAWYYALGAVVVAVTILVIKAVDTQMKLRT